jgi:hypothetical protein
VQIDPIKPTLIAYVAKRLELKFDELLSILCINFACNLNLRRYILAGLSELTFDPRPEIRRSALEVLFDTLKFHGGSFTSSFWRGPHSPRSPASPCLRPAFCQCIFVSLHSWSPKALHMVSCQRAIECV